MRATIRGGILLAFILAAAPVAATGHCPCYTPSSTSDVGCSIEAVLGTNPPISEWQEIFHAVAQGPVAWGATGPSLGSMISGCNKPQPPMSIAPIFPCELLKAIAMQESSWTQFCAPSEPDDQADLSSRTIISHDCGYGGFQVTSGMRRDDPEPSWTPSRVAADPFYNAATGAYILVQKWLDVNCVGDRQPQVIENWYSAVWAYNGQTLSNNPSNPNLNPMRSVYVPGSSHPTDGWPYQELIWGWMEHPPSEAHWRPLLLAYPNRGEIDPTRKSPPVLSEPRCAKPLDCTESRPIHISSCIVGPEIPSNLSQLQYNGATLETGDSTDVGSVILRGTIDSPTGKQVRLELEVRRTSEAFTSEANFIGQFGSSGSRSTCISGLSQQEDGYRWRARARDESGQVSPWVSFGGNSELAPDFFVANGGTSCVPCTASAASITKDLSASGSCGQSLSVTLSASPVSGSAPLNDINLTASVNGTETGTINYTFYCNRADSGTNITSGYAARYTGTSANPKTASGVCDYSSPGIYTAKVIAERGSSAAEARATVTVTSVGGSVPTVSTLAATSVTQTSAAFNGIINPSNSSNTTFWFEYGTSTSMSQTTVTKTLAAATSPSSVSIAQDGLSCGQQYFYRARASNAGGPSVPGSAVSFTTDSCGSGGPQSLELIADSSFEAGNNAWWVATPAFYINDTFNIPRTGDFYAYLTNSNGTAGDNLSGGMISPKVTIPDDATDADLRFYHSIETQETDPSTIFDYVDVYLVRASNQLTKVATISNLDHSGTTYVRTSVDLSSSFYGDEVQVFFRGSTNSTRPTKFRIDDVSLEIDVPAGGAPDVTTEQADQVSSSSARLNMTVDPNGADTTVWFDLEAGDSTPSDDTERLLVGSGSQSEDVSISVFGLECATTYYFRANAENEYDSDSGSVRPFTTSACRGGAPNADTDPAENITATSATLTADVDPNGLATQAWFTWGTLGDISEETPHVSVGSGVGDVNFSQTLTGLSCGTIYYFQNHASNSAGEDHGVTHSFTTTSCGAPSPSDDLLLFATRQACAGTQPAVLLGWTMPPGADPLVTIRRLGGGYTATVNTAIKGPVHEVDSGLHFGNTYQFTVEAQVNGATLISNDLTVSIASDECRIPVAEGDLPHRPLLWVTPAYCEDGVANVAIHWTDALGAQFYSLKRGGGFMPSATYDGLTGTSFVDSGLRPGGAAQYGVTAHNASGYITSWSVGVIVPGTVCSTEDMPGTFLAGVEDLVCYENEGAVTVRWSQSDGAAADYRLFEFYDHQLTRLSENEDAFADQRRLLDPGTVVRVVMQAQSATTPGRFREAYPVAQLIPVDVCGARTAPPSIGAESASYIRADQALLSAGVIANGSDTNAHFEWGTSAAYGLATPERAIGSGASPVTLGEVIAGLSCGTAYHYRVAMTNAFGTTYGADQVFITKPCPNIAPTFSFVEPNGTGDVADATFQIMWQDSDPDSSALITLSYSSAATCATPIVLASNIAEDDLANSYTWYTGSKSAGTYYLQAVITDGAAPPVTICSQNSVSVSHGPTVRVLAQGAPGEVGKDIWTTSVYSYAPNGSTPGGGLDDDLLKVGGWGDSYYSLLQFNLAGLPAHASSARLELFCRPRSGVPTGLYLDRITRDWDWRIQGTGRDRERLWWADRPSTVPVSTTQLPAPIFGQWYSFDITTLYNAWQAGTYPNYGLQLRPTSTSNRWSEFYSANYSDSAFRPRLVIEAQKDPTARTLDLERDEGKYLFINDSSQQGLDLTGNFTVEAWVKPESIAVAHTIVSKWSAGQRSYWVGFELDGTTRKLFVNVSPNGTTEVDKKLVYDLGVGAWRHIAVSCRIVSAGACDIYIDTQLVGTLTGFPSAIFSGSGRFEMGSTEGSRMLDGLVDEVRVWNKARTQSEVATDYVRTLAGTEPGLVAYYSFDGASGSITDKTANGNHLTSTGPLTFVNTTPF